MALIKLIIFVDRGNIVRSPIATAITRQQLGKMNLLDSYDVFSARTQGIALDDKEPVKFPNITHYPEQYEQSKKWLEEHKIDLSSHYSTGINSWFAEQAKVIFAMDNKTRKSLLELFPNREGKIHMFSEIVGDDIEIDDPAFVSEGQKFVEIYDGIENTIVTGFPKLLAFADGVNETSIEITNHQLRRQERK